MHCILLASSFSVRKPTLRVMCWWRVRCTRVGIVVYASLAKHVQRKGIGMGIPCECDTPRGEVMKLYIMFGSIILECASTS